MKAFRAQRLAAEMTTLVVARRLSVLARYVMTLIDTADAYGPFTNEELVGLVTDSPQTADPGNSSPGAGRCGRPEYVRQSIDGSLRRLRTDHVDLYQLHRVDYRFRSRRPGERWPRPWQRAKRATSACPK